MLHACTSELSFYVQIHADDCFYDFFCFSCFPWVQLLYCYKINVLGFVLIDKYFQGLLRHYIIPLTCYGNLSAEVLDSYIVRHFIDSEIPPGLCCTADMIWICVGVVCGLRSWAAASCYLLQFCISSSGCFNIENTGSMVSIYMNIRLGPGEIISAKSCTWLQYWSHES